MSELKYIHRVGQLDGRIGCTHCQETLDVAPPDTELEWLG